MLGKINQKKKAGWLIPLTIVVAVFLVSATAATMFNHKGNAGAQVAEAASRVDRQVDDTQDAFENIKELIPEEQRLEAVSPDSYTNEPSSGTNSEFEYSSPNNSGDMPMPRNGNAIDKVVTGSNETSSSLYGINPANGGASNAPVSADENDDQDTAGDVDQAVAPTLTFNGRAGHEKFRATGC